MNEIFHAQRMHICAYSSRQFFKSHTHRLISNERNQNWTQLITSIRVVLIIDLFSI